MWSRLLDYAPCARAWRSYWGVVEQVPDPNDGRAKLVRFSKQGEAQLFQGLAVLGELEQELGDKIGKRRMQELHTALLALEAALAAER